MFINFENVDCEDFNQYVEIKDSLGNVLDNNKVLWFNTKTKVAKMVALLKFITPERREITQAALMGDASIIPRKIGVDHPRREVVTFYCCLFNMEAYDKRTGEIL